MTGRYRDLLRGRSPAHLIKGVALSAHRYSPSLRPTSIADRDPGRAQRVQWPAAVSADGSTALLGATLALGNDGSGIVNLERDDKVTLFFVLVHSGSQR